MPNPWFIGMQIVLQKQCVNQSFAFKGQEPKFNEKQSKNAKPISRNMATKGVSREPKQWDKMPTQNIGLQLKKLTSVSTVSIIQFSRTDKY